MGEVSWGAGAVELRLVGGHIWAQTFTPLWTHTLERLRWIIKPGMTPAVIRVSIQYLKPDGTPTGADLVKVEWRYWSIDPLVGFSVEEARVAPIRIVAGIDYAFLIQTILGVPPFWPITKYVPLPSTYPRGKLIKSTDGGATWDTTDLGDLHFAEYGDPPVHPTPYIPPHIHWALDWFSQTNYNVNACTRLTTTNPCTLTMYVSETPPTPVDTFKIQRGAKIKCLDYHRFKDYRYYEQKERCDSIYHTFFIHKLNEGEKYWMCFTAETNFLGTKSIAPIFDRIHPGGPSFTKTLRPNAPGDKCFIPTGIPDICPNHYLNIDEATPDEDTTFISSWGGVGIAYYYDLYNIPNLPANERPIRQVHLTIRLKRVSGYAYVHLAKFGIKVFGSEWWSAAIDMIPTSYKNFHLHLYDNPLTSNPWTYAEVNDLQIGVALRNYHGIGWAARVHCTQVYCRIHHACEAYD